MNILRILIIFSAPLLLFISSCETEAKNVSLPDYNQKLVITSFISPSDRVSEITTGVTQKVFGDLPDMETAGNLEAFISDGTKEIRADTAGTGFRFTMNDMKIEEGMTYTIRVVSDKGQEVRASCTVPLAHDFKINVDTITRARTYGDDNGYKILTAEISITDVPDEANYFRLFCLQKSFGVPYWDRDVPLRLSDLEENIFSDKGKDGQKFFLRTIELNNFSETTDSSFLKIYLFNTDKAYYDFHNSFLNYSGGRDPFTENSPVFSNIEGGLGVFAAYTIDSLIFRLK